MGDTVRMDDGDGPEGGSEAGEPAAARPVRPAPPAQEKKGGNTCLIVGLIGGGCLAVGLVVMLILAALMLPALARARESARRAQCMSNLMQVGLALNLYAMDNDEEFPPELAKLTEGGFLDDPGVLSCPSASSEVGDIGYVYVSGVKTSDPPDYIVVYGRSDNHAGDGVNVLHVDAHVSWHPSVQMVRDAAAAQVQDLAAQGRQCELIGDN